MTLNQATANALDASKCTQQQYSKPRCTLQNATHSTEHDVFATLFGGVPAGGEL